MNVDRRFTLDTETLDTDKTKIAAEIEGDSDDTAKFPAEFRAQIRAQLANQGFRLGLKSRTFRIWLSDRSMAAGVGELVNQR